MAKAEYTKSAAQVDLEERQKRDNENPNLILSTFEGERPEVEDDSARDFTIEGNKTDAYVGVDPVYQNYASTTEKPLRSEKGAEKALEDEVYGNKDGNVDEDESDESDDSADDKKDEDSTQSSSNAPTAPSLSGTAGKTTDTK